MEHKKTTMKKSMLNLAKYYANFVVRNYMHFYFKDKKNMLNTKLLPHLGAPQKSFFFLKKNNNNN